MDCTGNSRVARHCRLCGTLWIVPDTVDCVGHWTVRDSVDFVGHYGLYREL
jgi:hypothetical protein